MLYLTAARREALDVAGKLTSDIDRSITNVLGDADNAQLQALLDRITILTSNR